MHSYYRNSSVFAKHGPCLLVLMGLGAREARWLAGIIPYQPQLITNAAARCQWHTSWTHTHTCNSEFVTIICAEWIPVLKPNSNPCLTLNHLKLWGAAKMSLTSHLHYECMTHTHWWWQSCCECLQQWDKYLPEIFTWDTLCIVSVTKSLSKLIITKCEGPSNSVLFSASLTRYPNKKSRNICVASVVTILLPWQGDDSKQQSTAPQLPSIQTKINWDTFLHSWTKFVSKKWF